MKAVFTLVVALGVSALIGGCHSTSPTAPEVSSSAVGMQVGSPADVAFLENMVVHHQQGLELVVLVPGHTKNPQVLMLADRMATQLRTELQGCQAQLLQWEASSEVHPTAADIPGMVDNATLEKLRNLSGSAFDELWLQSMIAHHRGAITMAQEEIEHGQSPEAISIAQSLIPLQLAEINQMNQLLGAP